MSNHFGLHCKTCDKSSDHSFNHGEQVIRGMIAALPHIQAAYDADNHTGYLQVSYLGDYGDVLDFGRDHQTHELVPEDEYGKRYELIDAN